MGRVALVVTSLAGLLGLVAGGASCGGGGDGKTGIKLSIRIDDAVPQATVDSITEGRVTVMSAGVAADAPKIAFGDKLRDRSTSFRYVDDGRFAGMEVSVKLELLNAGGDAVFEETQSDTMTDGETIEIDYTFGATPAVDGGVDGSTCPTPPTCVTAGGKACIDGTIVDFGTESAIITGGIELQIVNASSGSFISAGTVDSCGRFSTGSFDPPATPDVDLVVDDVSGGSDTFKKTTTRYAVARDTIIRNEKVRVLTAALDESLSVAAGFCTAPCTNQSTFAGRGSVALFYRHLRALKSNVRVTQGPATGTKPTLLTQDVFYFTDDAAGRQTKILPMRTDTSRSGVALAVARVPSALNWNGTGGLPTANLSWKERTATAPAGGVVIVDIDTISHTCDPLAQATMGCRNQDDGCYPDSAMPAENFCSHAGSAGAPMPCTFFNDCQIGLTCIQNICRPLCRFGGGAPGCTTPNTCQAIGTSTTVGACQP